MDKIRIAIGGNGHAILFRILKKRLQSTRLLSDVNALMVYISMIYKINFLALQFHEHKFMTMQKIIIALFLALSIASCRKDEQCPAEDFTGTYMGDAECMLGLTDANELQVVVSKVDDKTLEIDFRGNILTVDIKGCELEVDDKVTLGTGNTGSASITEGVLTLNYQLKALGIITEECDFVGTKI